MIDKYSSLHKGLVIKFYIKVISKFKFHFFAIVLASVVAAGLDIYIPLKILKLWNILSSNDFSLVYEAKKTVIFIFSLGLIRWMIRRSVSFMNSYFQANCIANLRKQAFSYMIGHSHSFFVNNFAGSLVQRVNKYARAFERLMDSLFDNAIPLVVRFIGTIIAVYTLIPKYSYILVVFGIVFLLTSLVYTKLKLKYDVMAAEADTKTVGALSDSIGNHSSIQLFTGNEYEREKVGGVVDNQKKANLINWYLWSGLSMIQSFYTVLIESVILWINIKDWSLGLITLPVIVLIQGYYGRLVENLWSFAQIVRTFYDGFADAQEMALILDKPYDIKDTNEKVLKDVKGEIVFDNVTYVYENNNQKVFDNFSLKIKDGERVALVGASGAGKSTFVKLLMRLFDLTEGRILIDGIDIKEISQNNLRENISFVPQDPVLFHRTLLENIRYGKRGATDEEVKNASSLAHCDKFINNLPLGFETYVGERGVKLSGGERQRVAIARAILKNAPILILDEATSALDSESEMLIQDALHNLIVGKTVIVIAHRLSTIRKMDRIIVVENGKIIEEGKHEDLIKNNEGVYKKLWDIQAGGFEIK